MRMSPVWDSELTIWGLHIIPLFWTMGLQSRALFFRILGGGAGGARGMSVCVLAYTNQKVTGRKLKGYLGHNTFLYPPPKKSVV